MEEKFCTGQESNDPSTYMYSVHRCLQSTIGPWRLLKAELIGFLFELETITTTVAMTLS